MANPSHNQNPREDGQIDPATLDVTAKAKPPRKRKRPPAPDELREGEAKATARAFARPYPPGIMLEPAGFDREFWTSPHNDLNLWHLQLADAFGTRSRAVIFTFMQQLQALCGDNHWDDKAKQWRISEEEYSAILAMVSTIKPRDEMEAALAAQMVAVHLMTMKVAARALKYDHDTQSASVAAKLARTFTIQMEALRANRTKRTTARQSIKVRKELHQHIHYHRGDDGNDRQAQGPRVDAVDERAALPSPDASGRVVPMPSRKGQGAVQNPRRG